MANKSNVLIWIPVYKSKLLLPELLALWQITQTLEKHTCILAGKRKDAQFLAKLANQLGNIETKLYPNRVFSSVSSYCNLLLSPRFYREFTGKYILVAQLDAWICRPCVSDFLQFDYVAPLIYPYPYRGSLADAKSIGVGVGGLSLRCCDSISNALEQGLQFYARNYMRMFLKNFSKKGRLYLRLKVLTYFLSNIFTTYKSASPILTALGCNEDWIIGIFCANRLRVAPRPIALRFGIDCYHDEQLELLRPELPFGLHSWWEDLVSLENCTDTLVSTLHQGWSSFLTNHGFEFCDDQKETVIKLIKKQLQQAQNIGATN